VRYVLLSCLLAATAAPAAAQDYRFANIPWGSDGATVKRLMVAQDFVLEKADSDGDYLFKGHLAGYDASVWALMAKDALVKVDIILLTPDPKARQAYRDMKTLLTTKYGKAQAVEAFEKPYADGDGNEDEAIKKGKAHFFAMWRKISGTDTSAIGLQISEYLNLLVGYESPRWDAEADRRRAKQAKELF
jgi:hypothetical protein